MRYNIFAERFEFFKIKERAEIMAGLQQNLFNEMLSSNDNKFVENWFPFGSVSSLGRLMGFASCSFAKI